MISDGEEDETLAQVLESEVLSEVSDQEETVTRPHKRFCLDEGIGRYLAPLPAMECNYVDRSSNQHSVESGSVLETGPERDSSKENLHTGHRWYAQKQIESGTFSKIPLELFHHTLKFLSSEDLVACSLVCRFLNFAASDEGLWRCLCEIDLSTEFSKIERQKTVKSWNFTLY